MWGDALDNWVFTRRVWNQHSYHVSNIEENGAVPSYEIPNWLDPYLMNNFRQNVQGEGLFWAPDLTVANLQVECEGGIRLYIAVDVINQGSRMVAAGSPVAIYANGATVDVLRTSQPLLPGQFEHMEYTWQVPGEYYTGSITIEVSADDEGDGTGRDNECNEDNNTEQVANIYCRPDV